MAAMIRGRPGALKRYATKWDFELFSGKSAVDLPALLAKNDEVFGRSNRKMMSDALQLARKWSADTEVKLGGKSAKVDAAIRRWFLEEGASAADVESVRTTLLAGFKKITSACNSGQGHLLGPPEAAHERRLRFDLRLGQRPRCHARDLHLPAVPADRRAQPAGQHSRALAVRADHRPRAEPQAGRHEDKRYDYQGLKPSASFPAATALVNADSWAYFCGDVLGAVPRWAVKEALS